MECILIFLFLATGSASQQKGDDVRAVLERRYEELARANERRDLAAVRAIRHETFHAILPDGRIAGPMEMDENSKAFFASAQSPITVKFTIRALWISGDGMIVAADVFQEVSRFREIEGQRRRLDTTVVQRETWVKTNEGWRMKLVDNLRDQTRRIIDGKD